MAHVSPSQDRERLECEIGSQRYQGLLVELQASTPFFHRFATWGDIIAFMRQGNSDDPAKDEVLRPILAAKHGENDDQWNSILLVIFWPGLESIRKRKRHWAVEKDELWLDLTYVFLETVSRIDINQRHERLVQKIINGTIHRLYEECHRKWRRSDREMLTDPSDLEAMAGGNEDAGLCEVRHRLSQEAAIRRLRWHQEEGHVSEADFFLLVGTCVYGRPLAQYAREVGIPYEVGKKRRQRALAAIRWHETNG